MPIYSIQGPDGKTYSIEGPPGATREQIIAQIQAQLFTQQTQPSTGVLAAAGKGLEGLLSSTQTGYEALTGSPEAAAAAAKTRQQAAQAQYADQVGLDKLQEAYRQRGLLGGAGELARQVPLALAEQAPNIAATLGGARLGATAGAVFGAPGAIAGGVLGAAAPSLIQQFGGNIERQAETGQPISTGRAAAAALPQAALDVAGTLIPFGKTLAGKVLGPKVEALLAKGATEEAEKLAQESFKASIAKGLGVGALAEIPTEVAQQFLERAQAGLPLTSPDALKEYGETAYQVGLLAPLGAVGRFSEKSAARQQLEQAAIDKAAAERAQAAQQKALQSSDPNYLLDLNARYEQSLAKMKQLQEAAKKPGKGADETALQDYQDALKAMKEYRTETHSPLVREWRENRDAINALLAPQREEAARAAAAQEQMAGLKPQETGALFGDIKEQRERDKAAAEETARQQKEAAQAQAQAQREVLSQQHDYLQQRLDDIDTQYATERGIDSPDVNVLRGLANQRGQIAGQLKDVQAQLLAAGPEAEKPKTEAQLLKAADKAYSKGDYAQHDALMGQIVQARARAAAPAAPVQEDLFADADRREAAARELLPTPADMKATRRTGEQDYQDFLAGLTEEDPAAQEARQQYETELRMREEGAKATEGKIDDVLDMFGGKAVPDRYPRRNYAGVPDSESVFSIEDELSKSAFPQGRPPQAPYEKEMARLHQVQFQAFHQLRLIIDAVRAGHFIGSGVKSATPARVTKKMLIARAEQAFGDFSRAAVDEVNAFREGVNLPALSAEAQIKLLDSVQKDLRELVVRLQRDESETDWHLIPAQMRAGKVVKSAEFVKVPAAALEQKFGAPLHAPAVIMQGIEETKRQYAEEGRVEQKPGRATGPVSRVEGEFRLFPQDQEAVGRAAEQAYQANPAQHLQQRFDRLASRTVDRMTPRDKNILSNALEVLGTPAAPTNLSETIKDLLDQLENRTGIGPREEKALADAVRLAQEAKQQDQLLPGGARPAAQRGLFDEKTLEPTATERASAANFQKLLDTVKRAADEAKSDLDELNRIADETVSIVEQRNEGAVVRPQVSVSGNETTITVPDVGSVSATKIASGSLEGAYKVSFKPSEKSDTAIGQLIGAVSMWANKSGKVLAYTSEDGLDAATRRALSDRGFAPEAALYDTEYQRASNAASKARDAYYSKVLSMANIAKDRVQAIENELAPLLKQLADIRKKEKEEGASAASKAALSAIQEKLAPIQEKLNAVSALYKRIDKLRIDYAKGVIPTIDGVVPPGLAEARAALIKAEDAKFAAQKDMPVGFMVRYPSGTSPTITAKTVSPVEAYKERLAVVENTAPNTPEGAAANKKLVSALKSLIALEEKKVSTKALESAKERARDKVQKAEDTFEKARKAAVDRAMSGEGTPGIRYTRDPRAVALQDDIEQLRNDLADLEEVKGSSKEKSRLRKSIKEKEAQLDALGLSPTNLRAEPVLTQAEKTERRAEVFEEERRTKPDTTGAGKLSTESTNLRTSVGPAAKPIRGGIVTQKRVVTEPGRSKVSKKFLKQSGKIAEKIRPQKDARAATIAALVKRKKLVFDEAMKEAFDSPEVRKVEREAGMGSPRHLDAVALKADEIARNSSEPPVMRMVAAGLNDNFDTAAGQKLVDAFKARLDGDLKITYVPDFNNMPLRLRKHFAMEGMKAAKGGLFKAAKELVIFGNTHADMKDFETTLVHEALGHYGVVKLLGIDEINRLAKETDVDALAEKLGITDSVNASSEGFKKAFEAVNKTEPTPEQIKANKLEEVIAYLAEKRATESIVEKAGRFIKQLVGALRNFFRKSGFTEVTKLSTTDLYKLIQDAEKNLSKTSTVATVGKDGDVVFRFASGGGDGTPKLTQFDYRKNSSWQNLKGNVTGLRFNTQFVDRLAPLQAVSKKDADAQRAAQMMYYTRMADQRMSFAAQSAGNGALNLVQKPDGSYVIESVKGANLHNVSKLLSKAGIKDSVKAEQMFTAYLAGERAANKGWEKLNFSNPSAAKADYAAVLSYLDANPKAKDAFEKARNEYNEYNKGLVNFLVQTGAISKELASKLLKDNDYVPFYRSNGDRVELVISGEHPITIGSLKDQPYLHELVGGEEKILPFMTSAIQNTIMMTDMGLRNMATKNAVYTMRDMFGPEAVTIGKKGGPAGANVLRFYDHGVEKHAVLDRQFFDAMGIPADLLVHGMEGIKTTLPFVVRMLGIPARFLRHMVTRNPMYALRQLIRDSFSASLLTGANITPVASAVKELASMVRNQNPTAMLLANRGIIGGQTLTGTAEDMETMLRDAAANKTGWSTAMAKLDQFAMQSDAATRVAMYNSFIKQGMSEMEATLATLESMNFNKRGVSPSIHWINTMVPFFNAQIQGLNVLSQALRGGMTGEAKVNATRKLLVRGLMLTAATLAYAAVMQDDDDYKELTPEERWQYWFMKLPGQKEPLRIPIPFEAGVLFKAIPELMVNASAKDSKNSEVWKAVRSILINNIPGGGSYGVPQAPKAILEVATNHDFFTGHEIENRREQQLDPAERFRDTNSELAKSLGKAANISPRMIDHLMNGYMSATGMMLVKALDPMLSAETVTTKATPKLTQGPGGSLFQGTEAYGLINGVYDYMQDAEKAKATFDKLVKEGRRADALAYLQENAKRLQAAPMAGGFKTQMQKLTELERQVRADQKMSPDEKRKTLDLIQERRKALAKAYRPYTE